jgi:hypothetical protein
MSDTEDGAAAERDEYVRSHVTVLPGSLEARMQEKRRDRESRSTELFEPPGFEDVFRVEMQVLGYRVLSAIALSEQRVRDEGMRALYIAAEQVLEATVGFKMVMPNGNLAEAEGVTWMDLARKMYPELGPETRPRTALIRLLDGAGVLALNNDWFTWNTVGNEKVDRDLALDFQTTE